MAAAIIVSISVLIVLAATFYYWRSKICRIAARDLSERIRIASAATVPPIDSHNFHNLLSLHDLAGNLHGLGGAFCALRAYYWVLDKLRSLVPAAANRCDSEMITCSRYVAARLDERLKHNLAYAARIRAA